MFSLKEEFREFSILIQPERLMEEIGNLLPGNSLMVDKSALHNFPIKLVCLDQFTNEMER